MPYKVHRRDETICHLVSQADDLRDERPLCRAKSFYRFGRPDLGGFDMTFFNPKDLPAIPDDVCKTCKKTSQGKSSTFDAASGTYIYSNRDTRARKKSDQDTMWGWDRRFKQCRTLDELKTAYAEAENVLKGYMLSTAGNWRDDAERILRSQNLPSS